MARELQTNMDALAELERIETGELDAEGARAVLRRLLSEAAPDDVANHVYAALRSWTGRMMRANISGDDLRLWHNLIKATAAQFRDAARETGIRINVLAELVYERVGISETRRPEDVLCRRHVRPLLAKLAENHSRRVERSELRIALGLEQANLTRVCTLLLDAGLIARREDGRTVAFELTADGLAYALATQPLQTSHNQEDQSLVDGLRQSEWQVFEEQDKGVAASKALSIEHWAEYDEPLAELPLAA